MKKIDEIKYFNHKMLLNMIEDICITFPNIILNKMDYKEGNTHTSSLEIK